MYIEWSKDDHFRGKVCFSGVTCTHTYTQEEKEKIS